MFDIRDILEKSCESKIDVFHLRDNLRDLLLKRIEQNGIYAEIIDKQNLIIASIGIIQVVVKNIIRCS